MNVYDLNNRFFIAHYLVLILLFIIYIIIKLVNDIKKREGIILF